MSASNRWWRDYDVECIDWWWHYLREPETVPRVAYTILVARYELTRGDPAEAFCGIVPSWIWMSCPVPFCSQRIGHLGEHV